MIDFAGGAKSLQALVGGSVDVVTGAFEHNMNLLRSGAVLRMPEQAAIDALYDLGLTPYETKIVGSDQKTVSIKKSVSPGVSRRNTSRVPLKELSAFTSELASLANFKVASPSVAEVTVIGRTSAMTAERCRPWPQRSWVRPRLVGGCTWSTSRRRAPTPAYCRAP